MPRISAVLFDFGKVLSGPPSAGVWDHMLRVSDLDHATFDRVYWAPRDDYDRGALDATSYWQQVATLANRSFGAATIAALIELDVELWTEMNQPMLDWVAALHRAGIRTGILSNIGDAMAEGIQRKFDWIGNFHHAVWSHSLKLRKPEPAIYAAAVAGLGVPAREILFLDDKEENVVAAREAGMQSIVYRDHIAFEAEMQQSGYGDLLHPETMLQHA